MHASSFRRITQAGLLLLAALSSLTAATRPDRPIASFETADFTGWSVSGDLFGTAPHRPASGFTGRQGAGIAWSGAGGTATTGRLVSAEFKIERRYLSFLVLGERNFPETVGVELLDGDRVLRASSATERITYEFADVVDATEGMHWRTWDVGALEGKTVRLSVNDFSRHGVIAVDEFIQTDTPRSVPIDASQRLGETYRPQFHFTAALGWMNDPNGLVYYRGTWHLFHQYSHPGNTAKVWGHATSTDLFHWQHRPAAFRQDSDDNSASGSGMVDYWNASGLKQGEHDPILLFYTRRPPGPKSVKAPIPSDWLRATQELAYSVDGGVTWQRHRDNPIFRTQDYRDRDPKVIYRESSKQWFMLLPLSANNADRPNAAYGIYRSPNLTDWKMIQRLGPDGWYWECPDLFELSVDGDPKSTKWLLLKGSGDYYLGTFDDNGFHAEAGPIRTKFGGNYYATQTFQDAPDGRRVQLGWMNTGDKREAVNVFPGMPFNQQMSVPRELILRSTPAGPRLFRLPVKELESLRVRSTALATGPLKPGSNPLAALNADLLDLELELIPGDAKKIFLTLRGEEVIYDVAKQSLHAFKSTAPLPLIDGRLLLRLLLDRTSIEIFGQEGLADISGVFFPDPANRSLSLSTDGGTANVSRLIAHELKSAWAAPMAK